MYDNWHSADVTENGLQNLTTPTIISYIDMFYHRIQISQGPQYSFYSLYLQLLAHGCKVTSIVQVKL
jgi:hypothetical protein